MVSENIPNWQKIKKMVSLNEPLNETLKNFVYLNKPNLVNNKIYYETMNDANSKIIFPSKFIELDDVIFKDTCISRNDSLVVYKRTIIKEPFVCTSRNLMYNMINKLSDCSNRIIAYIGANLDFNTNVIEFSKTDFSKYHKCSKVTYIRAIEELEDYNIIERYSGRYSVYGVNYKYIFYGNIVNFIEQYRTEFANIKPIVDENNRIVLDDDLYNKYKNNVKIKTINLKIKNNGN